MNSGETFSGAVFFLALGAAAFGACKAQDAGEAPLDAAVGPTVDAVVARTVDAALGPTETYQVSWTQAHGFIIDRREAAEVEAHALEVRTPPSRTGDEGTFMLWATGEGISLPFGMLAQHLPAGEPWPDVVMPETMETGTQLELYSLQKGKLDALVAYLTVNQELYSSELLSYMVTMSRCSAYCDSAECGNCSWGTVCSAGMGYAGVEILSSARSRSPVCEGDCTECAENGDHYCWSTQAMVWCAPAR